VAITRQHRDSARNIKPTLCLINARSRVTFTIPIGVITNLISIDRSASPRSPVQSGSCSHGRREIAGDRARKYRQRAKIVTHRDDPRVSASSILSIDFTNPCKRRGVAVPPREMRSASIVIQSRRDFSPLGFRRRALRLPPQWRIERRRARAREKARGEECSAQFILADYGSNYRG